MDETEIDAVRAVREESEPTDTAVDPTILAFARTLRTTAIIIVVAVSLGVLYLKATDPCFDHKARITVEEPMPRRLTVWGEKCRVVNYAGCVCAPAGLPAHGPQGF